MPSLKKYDIKGKETGTLELDETFINAKANSQMVKDYIVAIRANARQWSASTKTRAEVAHTTKKCVKQKGTGGARHGSTVAPQFRGGGIVFGPKPKFDQHVKINKKERKAAIRFLIGEKLRENKVIIIDDLELKAPHTKTVSNFFKKVGLDRRVLVLGETTYEEVVLGDMQQRISVHSDKHENFTKSARNIPYVQFSLASNISGYDVMVAHNLVMTASAFDELKQWLA